MPSPLTQAIGQALANVARAVAQETPPQDPAAVAAAQQAAEDAAHEANEATARTVFSGARYNPKGYGATATAGTRTPTADERTAARVLARALSTAGVRERVAVKSTSPIPPGRLRMRGALAADAQRAAGAVVTAEPFTRTTRLVAPAPPLRLGIACDVSGSMGYLRRPVASTAWILAHAGAPRHRPGHHRHRHLRRPRPPDHPPRHRPRPGDRIRGRRRLRTTSPPPPPPSTAPSDCPAPAPRGCWSSCPTGTTTTTNAPPDAHRSTGCARPGAPCCG